MTIEGRGREIAHIGGLNRPEEGGVDLAGVIPWGSPSPTSSQEDQEAGAIVGACPSHARKANTNRRPVQRPWLSTEYHESRKR